MDLPGIQDSRDYSCPLAGPPHGLARGMLLHADGSIPPYRSLALAYMTSATLYRPVLGVPEPSTQRRTTVYTAVNGVYDSLF